MKTDRQFVPGFSRAVMLCGFSVICLNGISTAQTFSFASVADPRSGGDTWRNALSEIRDMTVTGDPKFSPTEFILLCGDMDPLDQRFGDHKSVFSDKSKRPDLLPVIGNHEFENGGSHYRYARDNVIPSITGSRLHRRNTSGCSYYYDYENVRIISIDAYEDGLGGGGCVNGTGIAWVKNTIESAPSSIDHIFLGLHDPAFPRHRHVGDSYDACRNDRDTFWRMLVAHNDRVRALFVGHTHYYYRMRVKDPGGPASNGSSYPDEEGGVYQVDCGAAGNNGDGKNTVVQVQIQGENVYFRVLQANRGGGKPFKITDEWEIVTVIQPPHIELVTVTPDTATILVNETTTFSASARDQFGQPFPTSFSWKLSGGGMVDNGTFTSTGAPGSFHVIASAGNHSDSGVVVVKSEYGAPVAHDTKVSTGINTPLTISLPYTAETNGPFFFSIIKQPTHGAIAISAADATYTPATDYSGTDMFSWKMKDESSGKESNEGTVSVSVVSEIQISNLTTANGSMYKTGNLETGAVQYIDRNFTFTTIPEIYSGMTYIQTANNDKTVDDDSFLSFSVNQPVMVYIAHDKRIDSKPSWLNDFSKTGDVITSDDSEFDVYAKAFSDGVVTLGNNGYTSSGCSMYSVIIGPNDSTINGIIPLRRGSVPAQQTGNSTIRIVDMRGRIIKAGAGSVYNPRSPIGSGNFAKSVVIMFDKYGTVIQRKVLNRK